MALSMRAEKIKKEKEEDAAIFKFVQEK